MKIDNSMAIWIIVAVVAVLLFGGFGMMGFGSQGGMMGNWGYGGMWVFGWLFMALGLVALALFIVWLVKQLQDKK